MRQKISTILVATYLIAGCSSGGGTSGAGSGSGTGSVVAGELLITADLLLEEISVDTFINLCDDDDPEDGLSTRLGNFRIAARSIADLTGGVLHSGIILTSYEVSFRGRSPGAPPLTNRTFNRTTELSPIPGAAEIPVILVDLSSTMPEFQRAQTQVIQTVIREESRQVLSIDPGGERTETESGEVLYITDSEMGPGDLIYITASGEAINITHEVENNSTTNDSVTTTDSGDTIYTTGSGIIYITEGGEVLYSATHITSSTVAEVSLNPFVSSYDVTVTMRGRTLAGETFTIAATTFIELGNFNRC